MAAVVAFLVRYVTERFGVPPYTNCNFASGLMLANKATHNAKGTSSVTVRKLRAASGAQHAATGPKDLLKAYSKLYGWTTGIQTVTTFASLVQKLHQYTAGAVIYIYPHKLPLHYRRWDTAFVEGHAVYVQATGNLNKPHLNSLWFIDPMIKEKGYRGEWIAEADLKPALMPGVESILIAQDRFV